jgi:hypothetical protein
MADSLGAFPKRDNPPVSTPARHSSLLTRLTESAKQLDRFERAHIEQLSSKLAKQKGEIACLESELTRAQRIKDSHCARLLELHRTFVGQISALSEFIDFSNPTIDELISTNRFLMSQLTPVLGDSGEVQSLEVEVEKLETELKCAQRQTSEITILDSPDSDHNTTEALKTLKILKAQYFGVEEYLRNGATFEKSEIQSEIRQLQRKSASLLTEIRVMKESTRASTLGELGQRRKIGIQSLTEFLRSIEDAITAKEQHIAETRIESERELKQLDELIKQSDAMEAEVRKYRAQISNAVLPGQGT